MPLPLMHRRALLSALVLGVILVPFALWGQAFETWAASLCEADGGRTAWTAAALFGLLAGDIVLPGSCTRAIDVRPGDEFVAKFAGLGSVRLSFE